jgi:MFS transporter, PPP family, 3-phenylpropionic acid transporter
VKQSTAAGILPLSGFYFLYFAALGITLPFLPAYFKSLSLSASQIGVLLALPPLLSLFAPPWWGQLADRSGRADRVLKVIALGSTLCFAAFLWAERFASLLVAMGCYAFFTSSVTPLVDSLALQRVALFGGSFARIRLFGSLGFVLSSSAFGLVASAVDRLTIVVAFCLLCGQFLWSLTLQARRSPGVLLGPFSGLRLISDRDLAAFLVATCLHWIACSPFNVTFSIHVQALGLAPAVVGLSAGLGVLTETIVMYAYPRFANLFTPRQLLLWSFLASAFRWAGLGLVRRPELIVLLSLLHGLTFGAFYVASVAFVSGRVWEDLRASGQALFASVTFGLGGLIGYLSSGVGYDAMGGQRLFSVAAAVELAAAALILRVRPSPPGIRRRRPPGAQSALAEV